MAALPSLRSADRPKAKKTPAPERFSEEDLLELRRVTAEKRPDLIGSLDLVLAKFLAHYRGQGELRADWVEAAKKWIADERRVQRAQDFAPSLDDRETIAARHRAEIGAQFGPGPSYERQRHIAALLERAVGVNREVLWALERDESKRICESERELPARVSPVAALGATA